MSESIPTTLNRASRWKRALSGGLVAACIALVPIAADLAWDQARESFPALKEMRSLSGFLDLARILAASPIFMLASVNEAIARLRAMPMYALSILFWFLYGGTIAFLVPKNWTALLLGIVLLFPLAYLVLLFLRSVF